MSTQNWMATMWKSDYLKTREEEEGDTNNNNNAGVYKSIEELPYLQHCYYYYYCYSFKSLDALHSAACRMEPYIDATSGTCSGTCKWLEELEESLWSHKSNFY